MVLFHTKDQFEQTEADSRVDIYFLGREHSVLYGVASFENVGSIISVNTQAFTVKDLLALKCLMVSHCT